MHHLLAAKEDELSSAAMGVLVLVGLPRPDRARSDDADDATAAARNRAGKRVGGKKGSGQRRRLRACWKIHSLASPVQVSQPSPQSEWPNSEAFNSRLPGAPAPAATRSV